MEELTTETQAKRPVLLTVLVILSAIYIIGSLLAVTSALISGPLSEEALETELEGLYELSAELSANGAGEQLARSEEHTSELQSRPHLVCRLLLEKKKKKKNSRQREDQQ